MRKEEICWKFIAIFETIPENQNLRHRKNVVGIIDGLSSKSFGYGHETKTKIIHGLQNI
jgi:hypothetical protein